MKTYPLRLDERVAAELRIVAEVEGLTVADEIRAAIAAHLDARRVDPEFQRQLGLSMQRDLETTSAWAVAPRTAHPRCASASPTGTPGWR